MRVYKLNKTDYKRPIERLYKKIGVVYGRNIMVSDVYMSKEDIVIFRNNMAEELKKEYPYRYTSYIKTKILPFVWFNIGPSELLSKAIKKGYVLIDDKAIECGRLHSSLADMKIFDTLHKRAIND